MMDTADTVFSLDEAMPLARDVAGAAVEGHARLQAGSLARGSLREICFLRKITRLGAVLWVESAVREGERLELVLMTGDQLAGTVAWFAVNEVGLLFDEPADVFGLITRNLTHQPGDARRMPRIEVRCPALIEAGTLREFVTVLNLSDGGARLETRTALGVNQQVTLTLDSFRPITGSVRWSKGQAAGIAFNPELSWQELMPWLKETQAAQLPTMEMEELWAGPLTPRNKSPTRPQVESFGFQIPARVREGSRRWSIEVREIDTRKVRFVSYAALEPGRLFWISLPGLSGWPARITERDGDVVTCEFTQPLHPAVLERVRALAMEKQRLL